ncbi:MAG: hypothetical protein PVJ92_01980 [Candidatus Dependentiae bacterium]|jgi:hypothetical protein
MILETETAPTTHEASEATDAATEPTIDAAQATEEAPELTEEQKEQAEATARTIKMLEELDKAGRKLVLFAPPMADATSATLDKTLSQLNVLSQKITGIKQEINAQHEEIRDRVTAVDKSELITVNIDVQRAEDSVKKYSDLLDRLLEEIGHEVRNLTNHRSLEKQTYLQAWKHEPSEFNAYINHKVGMVRKQSKRIERDLDVSYSRYKFSFENHRKQLTHVEALLKYNEAIKQHKASQAAQETENNK